MVPPLVVPPPYYGSAMSGSPRPQSAPTYLRELAARYDATAADVTAPPLKRRAARSHATRLLEIATELDHLQATAGAAHPPRDLSAGLTAKVRELRAVQAAPLTPAELAEIRGLVGSVRRG